MRLKKIILAVSLLLCTALILCSCFKLPAGGGDKPTEKPETKETQETTPEQTTPEPTTPEPTTTPEQAAVGLYELFAISFEGILVEPMAFDMTSSIELKEDMTGVVSSNLGTGDVNWSISGNIITLTDSGEPIDLEFDGKVLTLDYGEGSLGLFARSDADLSGYTVLTAEEFFSLIDYVEPVYTNIQYITPRDTIEESGDFYSTRFGFSLLTESEVESGWYYSVSYGTEDVVDEYEWSIADSMHTAGSFGIFIYNAKENMTEDFNSRFKGIIVFNGPADFSTDDPFDESYLNRLMSENPGMEVFELTPVFANPGQTIVDSGKQAYSFDARLLGEKEGGYMSCLFDMSEAAYKSLMEHDSSQPMMVYFTYGGDTLYYGDVHEFFDTFCSDY